MPFYLDDQHREWIYTLQIAGLAFRYTSDPRASTSPIEGHPTSALYTDVAVMLAEDGVSAIDETLDLMRSSYDGGSMTIRLARFKGEPGDPALIFGRSGRRAATAYALVTRGIGPGVEAPFEVRVDADLSGLSYPRLVHVGAETMYASEFDGDGTPEDPYTLTITARGVGGTLLYDHVVDASALDFPVLTTDEVVFFQARPAVLIAEPADGSEPPAELFRGFLAKSPKVEKDGSVTVEIVSLAAVSDQEVTVTAPGESTTLVTGYHAFAQAAGSIVEVWQDSPLYTAAIRENTAAASGAIDVLGDFGLAWAGKFDSALPFGHPRAGDVQIGSDGMFYEVTGTSDGDEVAGTLDIAAGPADDVRVGSTVQARRAVEARRAYIVPPGGVPEILVWPGTPEDGDDGALNRINAQLVTENHLGDEGAWVSLGFAAGGDGECVCRTVRWSRSAAPNGLVDGGDRVAILDWWAPELAAAQGSTWNSPAGPGLRALTSWSTTLQTRWPYGEPEYWFDGIERGASRMTDLCWFPLVWTDPVTVVMASDEQHHNLISPYRVATDFQLYDCATAFYQRGEPYALVESAIDVTDGIVTIQATTRQRSTAAMHGEQGGAVRFQARVTDIEAVVLANGPRSGDTVYKLFFASPLDVPSFGEFTKPGMEGGVTISATREDFFSSPLATLRWLLGNQNALGRSEAEVDFASIDRLPPVPWSQPFNLPGVTPDGNIKFRDLLDGVLRMTRTALVMRGPDAVGRTRLTLISTGITVGAEAVASLDLTTIAAEPMPESDLNNEVLNGLQIDSNYDETEEEFRASSRYFEKASIATHGKGALDAISAYGFTPDNPPRAFAPAARALFDTYSEYRRVWKVTVSTSTGLRLPVGSVVQVSHPELIDHRGAEVVLGTGVVVGRRLELWKEGAELTIESYDRIGAGWNAAMRVTEVVDAASVRVAANAYSDAENAATGAVQIDLDAFAVGDVVTCEPAFDHGGAVDREIVAITPAAGMTHALIEFDGAHGLAVGDSVVPSAFATASDLHRRYAYQSDGEGSDDTVMV